MTTQLAPADHDTTKSVADPADLELGIDSSDEITRLNLPWKIVIVVFTMIGILLTMNQAFFWNLFGVNLLTHSYLYFTLACFLSLVFLIFPVKKGSKTSKVPFYDVTLWIITVVTTVHLGINGENILTLGWDYIAPATATVASFVLWFLVIESLRRTAGLIVALISLAFSLYPMIAGVVPLPFLQGIPFQIDQAARIHAMGSDSILGLPLQTAASIIIGFLLFGVALQHTGGASFFYNFSMALFGRFRGGAAKVSVFSSASLGMISGSAVSNVLTSGPMTIPAMKKTGFPARYAAGIEATASTGGTITPPIMGSAAFLMVAFIGVPYSEIAVAAAIPALLYYFGIFLQVDAYSAKNRLRGINAGTLKDAGIVLLQGWPYVLALAGLTYLLVGVKIETQAPFWIIGFLLVVAAFKRENRMTFKRFFEFLFASGKTIAEILGVIAGVGLIVGGLSMTGVSLSLASELINAVGDNLLLILIAGALTSFILGMGMSVSAVYVLLAVVMAPALVALGVNPIAAHLFVIYWATVSWITPPVALAAFAAASIAHTRPMETAFTAMRLGAVKYLVPFAFVVNPALVAQEASLPEILLSLLVSLLGVYCLASAFEGWVTLVDRRTGPISRILLILAGGLLFWPEMWTSIFGFVLGVVVIIALKLLGKNEHPAAPEAPAEVVDEVAITATGHVQAN